MVIETGNRLTETISSRVDEVNSTLKTTGDLLVLDLSLRGGDVVSKLEQTGARITETIVQRANRVSGHSSARAPKSLADVLGNRGEAVREMLAARLTVVRGHVQSRRRGTGRADRPRLRPRSAISSPAISANSTAP